MGPRSWDRGERPSIAGVGDTAGQLQWGRGLGTAESIALIRIALTWHALQWGRGLGTAERARHRRSKISQRRSFNGAAVLGPRRGGGAHRCSLLENTASMGPRSWDRGEPRATRTALPVSQLQWGRGLGTAERGERAPLRTVIAQLEWGRGLGTAESSLPHGHDCTERMASMGPRSWDRGEHGPRLGAVGHALASMGPRSWDRGEVTARHCATLRERGFNGAAVLGPRRASKGT